MIEEPWCAQAGILSGREIIDQIASGRIKVEPGYSIDYINPASLDLTLGAKVAVYKEAVVFGQFKDEVNTKSVQHFPTSSTPDLEIRTNFNAVLDSRRRHDVHVFEMDCDRGWLLKPGIGYLMHTAERICTDDFVPVLDGKSSLGRLFMTAHVTAGYGDPGFNGQYTLEVVVTQPVIVYPGMRFCQIRFHTLVGSRDSYREKGHYVGSLADGPVPSMSWKQFEEQYQNVRSK